MNSVIIAFGILIGGGLFILIIMMIRLRVRENKHNLIEWTVGDEVTSLGNGGRFGQYTITHQIVVFDDDGVYVLKPDEYKSYVKNNKDIEDVINKIHFLPLYEIEDNVSLKKRKKKTKIKDKLNNSLSYHNQLVTMQDEFEQLMDDEISKYKLTV